MTDRARNPRPPYGDSSSYGPAAPGPAPYGPGPYGSGSNGPASYGQQNDYSYSPPPAATVPPSTGFTASGQTTGWQPQQVYYSAPAPRFVVKSRGRRLNKVLLSATVLAIGIYLLAGSSGLYDPTVLQATAVGLTALGVGLAATAWHARSRGAMLVGVLMTAFLLVGSAVQGDYGTSMGNRTWRPTPTTGFPATYKLAAGDATLDLTQLGPSALGKTVNVSMGLGKLTILVPDGLPISAYAHVDVGNYSVFGTVYGDDPVRQTVTTPGWTPSSGIRIETRLRLGDVEVDHG
jgi:hypothetical protein